MPHQRSPIHEKVAAEQGGWDDGTGTSLWRVKLLHGEVCQAPDGPERDALSSAKAALKACGFTLEGDTASGLKLTNPRHVPQPVPSWYARKKARATETGQPHSGYGALGPRFWQQVERERRAEHDGTPKSQLRSRALRGERIEAISSDRTMEYQRSQIVVVQLRNAGFQVEGSASKGWRLLNPDYAPSNGSAGALVPVMTAEEEQHYSADELRKREIQERRKRMASLTLPPLPRLSEQVVVTLLAVHDGEGRIGISNGEHTWLMDVMQVVTE